jgi:hypothetical protein
VNYIIGYYNYITNSRVNPHIFSNSDPVEGSFEQVFSVGGKIDRGKVFSIPVRKFRKY